MNTNASIFARRIAGTSVVVGILGGVTVAGCSYSRINPEGAAEDVRKNSGYYELEDVEAGTARVVMRTAGAPHPAQFSVSSSSQTCKDFKVLGSAVYTGSGVVYPWIARLVQRSRGAISKTEPYLVYEAKPGQSIQVRGLGSWSDGSGTTYLSGKCAPLTHRFTPQEGHAYVVEFVWESKASCSLRVADATNRDAPIPIVTDLIEGC